MKKIIALLISMILIFALSAGASWANPFLATDIPPAGDNVTGTKIQYRIVGTTPWTEVSGSTIVQGTNFIVLDLVNLPANKYEFRVQFINASGWPSDYSDPLTAGKPGKPGSVRIIP